MKVKWLGHAAFLVTAGDGTRVVLDPYGEFGGLKHKPIDEHADIVVISHEHGDHCGGKIRGNPQTIKGAGERKVKGIEFKGIETYHDTSGGKERGPNTVFKFNVDGLNVCHMGDLGHMLSDSQLEAIGEVDVLMVPVGGFYTIDAATASKLAGSLKPRITIPMHYSSEKCEFPIACVDDFLENKTGVRKAGSSEIEIFPGKLPETSEIIVLEPAN